MSATTADPQTLAWAAQIRQASDQTEQRSFLLRLGLSVLAKVKTPIDKDKELAHIRALEQRGVSLTSHDQKVLVAETKKELAGIHDRFTMLANARKELPLELQNFEVYLSSAAHQFPFSEDHGFNPNWNDEHNVSAIKHFAKIRDGLKRVIAFDNLMDTVLADLELDLPEAFKIAKAEFVNAMRQFFEKVEEINAWLANPTIHKELEDHRQAQIINVFLDNARLQIPVMRQLVHFLGSHSAYTQKLEHESYTLLAREAKYALSRTENRRNRTKIKKQGRSV